MLEIKNLTIKIGLRDIIKDLSFNISKNNKLAIIGEEGNGKSTLLKIIAGICDFADIEGQIKYDGRIGYLEQTLDKNTLEYKVYDFLFENEKDYYNKINILYKFLRQLNISEELLERDKLSSLSGGEKVKIQLLKLLLDDVDILLLDEPTNDLDIDTLKWLETFINSTSKPIIYVSHDEVLLENTANMILHLELIKKKTECKWSLEKTNYKDYINKRQEYISKTTQIARKESENHKKKVDKLTKIMNKVHYEQNTITRQDPHTGQLLKKKMKSLKSQEKKLDEIMLTEEPDYEKEINLFFNDVSIPSSKKIIELNNETIYLGKKKLLNNIFLTIYGNQKIVIIGENGIGKTSLLKFIYKKLSIRKDIKVGYMPQDYDSILKDYISPINFISQSVSKDDITKARTFMGNMHFTHEEMTGLITNLSGGSKAKLFLIKLILDNSEILILDEPTRNVSPLSNPIIRKALQNFNGTIISVSHDRKYIYDVVDDIYELTKNGLIKK